MRAELKTGTGKFVGLHRYLNHGPLEPKASVTPMSNADPLQTHFLFPFSDPADVEEASQRPLTLPPQTPPVNASAQEEEISLLLGTLQVHTNPLEVSIDIRIADRFK